MDEVETATPTIQNRHGVNIYVVVNLVRDATGIAFLAHGLSDVHDTPHMQALNRGFLQAGYSTIRWDASNSWGRSGGSFWHAMATNHYDDMEDVITWARNEQWFNEPFRLAGYSLGGLAAGLYAQRFPAQVAALVLQSPVVAGSLALRRYRALRPFWQRAGFIWEPGSGWPGKRYRYELVRDLLGYDLREQAASLTMPTLVVVGARDQLNTARHQQLLVSEIPGPPTLHLITGAGHVLKTDSQLEELERTVREWLDRDE